jgi:DNA polymerase type B, organellar and viral
MFDFIQESYTVGSTEMYIPYGKDVYSYDVNALYPTSMKFNKFPTGNIVQFQGGITLMFKLDPNLKIDNSY